jgi:hypothetical protein
MLGGTIHSSMAVAAPRPTRRKVVKLAFFETQRQPERVQAAVSRCSKELASNDQNPGMSLRETRRKPVPGSDTW